MIEASFSTLLPRLPEQAQLLGNSIINSLTRVPFQCKLLSPQFVAKIVVFQDEINQQFLESVKVGSTLEEVRNTMQ